MAAQIFSIVLLQLHMWLRLMMKLQEGREVPQRQG